VSIVALVVGVVGQLLRGVFRHPVMVTVVRVGVRFAGTGIAVMMRGSVGHRRSRADPDNEDVRAARRRNLLPLWLTFG
jgi:hypothetical protein